MPNYRVTVQLGGYFLFTFIWYSAINICGCANSAGSLVPKQNMAGSRTTKTKSAKSSRRAEWTLQQEEEEEQSVTTQQQIAGKSEK